MEKMHAAFCHVCGSVADSLLAVTSVLTFALLRPKEQKEEKVVPICMHAYKFTDRQLVKNFKTRDIAPPVCISPSRHGIWLSKVFVVGDVQSLSATPHTSTRQPIILFSTNQQPTNSAFLQSATSQTSRLMIHSPHRVIFPLVS
jgi:hypothetical protein